MTVQDLEYIQHLERELKAVKRERDAAVRAINEIREVKTGNMSRADDLRQYVYGVARVLRDWQCGVCPENTEEK